MSKFEFTSEIYDEDGGAVKVEVNILSYSVGRPATYWEPPEYDEMEIAVFLEAGDCIYNTLSSSTQERLIEEAWEHLRAWDDPY